MNKAIEISVLGLQEQLERERERRTLREIMDSLERESRWKNLKERLRFKGIGCCGSTPWGVNPSNMGVREEEEEEDNQVILQPQEQEEITSEEGQIPVGNVFDPACVDQIPASSTMNLGTALVVERHLRAMQQDWEGGGCVGPSITTTPGIPLRIPLMRLLQERDGVDEERAKEREGGSDVVCCVCMGRRKGSAFIPCGHTFCRVCSRELWLNRGSCPLCNRRILEILDIF